MEVESSLDILLLVVPRTAQVWHNSFAVLSILFAGLDP